MDDVEEFLEHFGVKGMHWGIRNRSNTKSSSKKGHKNLPLKVLAAVGTSGAIAIGAAFAAKHFSNEQKRAAFKRVSEIHVDTWNQRKQEVSELFAQGRSREARDLYYLNNKLNGEEQAAIWKKASELYPGTSKFSKLLNKV